MIRTPLTQAEKEYPRRDAECTINKILYVLREKKKHYEKMYEYFLPDENMKELTVMYRTKVVEYSYICLMLEDPEFLDFNCRDLRREIYL